MQEEKRDLQELEINLNAMENDRVDESFLRMFGTAIKSIMGTMFGGPSVPFTVRGTQGQVKDFARVLGREKKYLDNYRKFGLDNAQTYKSKYSLDAAIKKFERATRLKWPFK
jgi:hypothetical protein